MITLERLSELLEDADENYLEFEKIQDPPSKRPDLCAFLKLEALLPGTERMVAAAEHDQFWLDVDLESLAAAATEDDIIYLVRCGVFEDEDSLSMWT